MVSKMRGWEGDSYGSRSIVVEACSVRGTCGSKYLCFKYEDHRDTYLNCQDTPPHSKAGVFYPSSFTIFLAPQDARVIRSAKVMSKVVAVINGQDIVQ